ncbi:hypothetical protein [Pseudochryseolinea flava]|uniref:Uncharacterized protein n=1 Tax=Pseudochryseolinea flava TaxID=2059302 RepID=A0A364Y4L5_9BACT|nr:hypothetical protein [Pseudochryseolinea flava]RAW01827.1 hypothetical protein DQQ10_09290 [Pseudochryseolinea flava]
MHVFFCFIIDTLFIGFGFYSVVYIVATLFNKKNRRLTAFDDKACEFIAIAGLVYLVINISSTLISLNQLRDVREMYWWALIQQTSTWTVATQILWIRKVRSSRIARFIISFFLVFSFERMVIYITSFHRDYIPAHWEGFEETGFFTLALLLTWLINSVIFCAMVAGYWFLRNAVKKDRQ